MTLQPNSLDAAAVDAAIELLAQATGRTPSVLALARHLGLANTTFRRRYPDVVARLHTSPAHQSPIESIGSLSSQHTHDLDRLRQRNRELTDNLDLAVSSIQRLAIDNRALRSQLEELASITHLPRTP